MGHISFNSYLGNNMYLYEGKRPDTSSKENEHGYKGKYFYRIERKADHIKFFGPLTNIRYLVPDYYKDSSHKFTEVIDGILVQTFTEDEILVTDKII
jgi:hypothetical protein